jgi:lipoic acid synthetase
MSRRPEWLRVQAPTPPQAEGMRSVRGLLDRYRLRTVCQGAVCPNAVECWGARTATFIILGEVCTRACRFCGIPTGDPGGAIDEEEPARLAAAVSELGLRYVVVTSVDRDDLADGGASVFAEAVGRIRIAQPEARVEVLVPDFRGDPRSLNRILAAGADVLGHNIETVSSLTKQLRDRRASYRQSLTVLSYLRAAAGEARARVKSGLMLGLGETRSEIRETLRDLRSAGVDIVTIGQYLQPRRSAAPITRYVPPEEFDEIAREAREIGFPSIASGPLVRSSYHAAELYEDACG